MPRKKPQAKKSPSVLSVETAYQLTPSEASLRTKPAQNHFPDATAQTEGDLHKALNFAQSDKNNESDIFLYLPTRIIDHHR